MTGGGHHRGRVTDRPGGAHWWGGTGRAGGGSHARRAVRRGPLLLLALVAVLLVAGVVVGVVGLGDTGGGTGPTPAASASGPPPATTRPAIERTTPAPDAAVLQSTIDEVLTGAPLRFAADSATPTPEAVAAVGRLAAVLTATPGPPVTVEGHTAPAGEETGSAQQLSRERADEVVRRLEAAGVPTGRLTAVGVGPARPLATLEASRRVELRVG